MKDEHSKCYHIRLAYENLHDTIIRGKYEVFNKLCNVKAFPLAQHFVWRVMLNKISTKDNLSNKGIGIRTSLCVMCELNDKSITYFFFTYHETFGTNVINRYG